MHFEHVASNRPERYSIGRIAESGAPFLAISVANRMVDYLEYYRISEPDFARYEADLDAALPFVDRCRHRQMDQLLIIRPGSDRGSAV